MNRDCAKGQATFYCANRLAYPMNPKRIGGDFVANKARA